MDKSQEEEEEFSSHQQRREQQQEQQQQREGDSMPSSSPEAVAAVGLDDIFVLGDAIRCLEPLLDEEGSPGERALEGKGWCVKRGVGVSGHLGKKVAGSC